jgi:uncharacterized membrane protein YeaQ/YmgE (transglycosylase-associated protein family)
MIGMSFGAWLVLLIEGFIAAIVMHLIVRYKVLGGFDGFMMKWIAGWIGAWLGSPVFGHWGANLQSIYLIPGILGAFSGAFVMTAFAKLWAQARVQTVPAMTPSATAPVELRKVS